MGQACWIRFPRGGPIVWPILGILAAAVLIIIRAGHFSCQKENEHAQKFNEFGVRDGNGRKMGKICRQFCESQPEKPLAKVILAGINFKHMQREDMENAIQETILREIPPLEKYLSTMGMLAAIAPLLGLLGTVTGMINTFHMITFYGTGDPRMMSGGISEALVTTMLGLMVAIPIMFAHTMLSRKVETTIGELEEKAVSFINMVNKTPKNIMNTVFTAYLTRLQEYISGGGIVMIPLALVSVVMWILILNRVMFFRRLYIKNMTRIQAGQPCPGKPKTGHRPVQRGHWPAGDGVHSKTQQG